MRTFPALQLIWPARPDDARLDRLLAALDDTAPTGVEEVPGGVRIYFPDERSRDRAAAIAAGAAADARRDVVDVPDDHWAERSQAALGPVRVGNVLVSPPWAALDEAACLAEGVTQVVIQPSMGFGTGHHATTRLCLDLLQRAPVSGAAVLDVGTGSGVLALAAWRLGAAGVLGIDHDPDALTSARDSAALNGATGDVELRRVDVTARVTAGISTHAFDIVLANLTGDMLARMAPWIAARLSAEGSLVVSGILADEAARVEIAFRALGWRPAARLREDEWVAWLLRSPTSPTGI